jgi:hypothetical protein
LPNNSIKPIDTGSCHCCTAKQRFENAADRYIMFDIDDQRLDAG